MTNSFGVPRDPVTLFKRPQEGHYAQPFQVCFSNRVDRENRIHFWTHWRGEGTKRVVFIMFNITLEGEQDPKETAAGCVTPLLGVKESKFLLSGNWNY